MSSPTSGALPRADQLMASCRMLLLPKTASVAKCTFRPPDVVAMTAAFSVPPFSDWLNTVCPVPVTSWK